MSGKCQIDPIAPILPDQSLGGLRLRMHVTGFAHLITGLGVSKPGRYEMASPFEVRYSFGNGSVQCAVDVRNGKVFKLMAGPGYQGDFDGKLHVGMTVEDALRIQPGLHYSEVDECLLCRGIEGIAFHVPAVDPSPSEVPRLSISTIVVFAKEIDTLKGQAGEW